MPKIPDNKAKASPKQDEQLTAQAGGYPADPTINVQNLLIAAVQRQDDLREADARRINEVAILRAEYTEKLTIAEAKRIDAIRAVDVNAVAVAAERATAQANVLANQVAASAETLRGLVAATAATIAKQLSDLTTQLTDRISALEKSQYTISGAGGVTTPAIDAKFSDIARALEGLGSKIGSLQDTRSQQTGSDPALAETLQTILKTQSATAKEIESLRDTRSTQAGASTQSGAIWGYVVAGIGAVVSVVLLILRFSGR